MLMIHGIRVPSKHVGSLESNPGSLAWRPVLPSSAGPVDGDCWGCNLVTDRVSGPSREWTLNKERREYSLTFKTMYVFIESFFAGFYISHPQKECLAYLTTSFSKRQDPETFPPGPKPLALD